MRLPKITGMEPLPRLTPATIDVLRALSEAEGSLWGLQIVKGTGRGDRWCPGQNL